MGQGDHEFYEVDLVTNSGSKKIVRLNAMYITGFSFYELNGLSFLSYISGEIDNNPESAFYLTTWNLVENSSNTIILGTCEHFCRFTGLSLVDKNGALELVTLYEPNPHEFEILHLSIDGVILKRILINLDDQYFNPKGLYYFNDKYATVVGKFIGSGSEPSSTILIFNNEGVVENELFFGIDEISNVAVSANGNVLFTTKSESKTINKYDMAGSLLGNIKLGVYPSLMQLTETGGLIVDVYISPEFSGIAKYLMYQTSDFVLVYLVHYYAIALTVISYYLSGKKWEFE